MLKCGHNIDSLFHDIQRLRTEKNNMSGQPAPSEKFVSTYSANQKPEHTNRSYWSLDDE